MVLNILINLNYNPTQLYNGSNVLEEVEPKKVVKKSKIVKPKKLSIIEEDEN